MTNWKYFARMDFMNKQENNNSTSLETSRMEEIISLCKRRGFVFQGSEIYGGLSGFFDYGPLGVELKKNIENVWWDMFVTKRDDIYGLDATQIMHPNVFQASGHAKNFADPMVEDLKTNKKYRADQLLEDAGEEDVETMSTEQMNELIQEKGIKSPDGNELGKVTRFNMMFSTVVGATADEDSKTYFRPETAQGIFTNYKNVIDSLHPKIPFGIAQIGKAFRNEIAPRDFIFRIREFTQMEIEYFVRKENWKESFENFRESTWDFCEAVGINKDLVSEYDVPKDDLAHYSEKTIDFEFEYPFGKKELFGLAYRTDYDLKNHAEVSRVDLSFFDQQKNERFIPHVIEPSLGLERTVLAVLTSAYYEDEMNGEKRVFLKLPANIAPYQYAVSPLLKNKPELVSLAREIYEDLKSKGFRVIFDDNGNIGKRYRRQDEIGTPKCITIDFDSLEDQTVTVRDRDTGEQERVKIEEL
jgi:glycyl-tRNA synthetase